nr:hypothetical protein [Thermococcus sp.]
MVMLDPVTLAMPLAKSIEEHILRTKKLPNGEEIRKILVNLGLEGLYSGRGVAVLRNRWFVVLIFPRKNGTVIDIIPSTGELSDALEVVVYHDRKLNALIAEILPANELEYEGNIGLEPVMVDAESGELISTPVLGDFSEDEEGPYLLIDGETFGRWKESGKLNVCPICGGELVWRGREAHCLDCGYRVKIGDKV